MADEPIWWRRPLLRDAEEERRASWLELFIDLMFVAIISALAKGLAADISWVGVARFTLVFLPAWWVWSGLTVFNDRFETDDVSHRLAFFAIMIALGGLAVSARRFFDDGFTVYALSYVLARVVLIALWIRAGVHNPRARALTTRDAIGYGAAAAVWLVAIAVPWPIRLWVVVLALAIDFGTPWTTVSIQAPLPRLSASHLPERFGLFIIIVLGEAVIGVESVAARYFTGNDLGRMIAGPCALALAFVFWWLYFDHVAENPPPPSTKVTLWWSYGHLSLALALGMFGAAAQAVAVLGATNEPQAIFLACASAALVYLSLGVLEFLTEPGAERAHPRRSFAVHAGAGAAALALGFAGAPLGATATLLLLVALGVVQIVYGFVTRAEPIAWDAEQD